MKITVIIKPTPPSRKQQEAEARLNDWLLTRTIEKVHERKLELPKKKVKR